MFEPDTTYGTQMLRWAKDLFPICRSITGPGVRESLSYLHKLNPTLQIKSIPSGEKVFDWIVPNEWFIRQAFIEDPSGHRIVDFSHNNLHVVGYSEPVNKTVSLEELNRHLHSIPDQPNAIPYVTSYYKQDWGFCIADRERLNLKDQHYRVVIDSEIKPGELNYGEIYIPANSQNPSDQEILLSTYICHPSLANNELSGPVVCSALAQWISNCERKYNYRLVFVPETIGAIAYLSRNLKTLKSNTVAGFQVTCVGDDRAYSFLPSRKGNTLADKAAKHALRSITNQFQEYTWLDRGSDERQYCSPGIDLPVASIMRSKYACYPEYHTSLDNFDLVTADGLQGGLTAIARAIVMIERNVKAKSTTLGEPQMGRRGLYPTLSKVGSASSTVRQMMNILSFADGNNDLFGIAEELNCSAFDLIEPISTLIAAGLLTDET